MEFILLIILIYLLVRSLRSSADYRAKKLQMVYSRMDTLLTEIKTARSISSFVKNWNSMDRLYKNNKSALRSRIDRDRLEKEFQWRLSDTIERMQKDTIKDIKVTYRNSSEFRQDAYDRFVGELDDYEQLFSDETNELAEELLEEVTRVFEDSTVSKAFTRNTTAQDFPYQSSISRKSVECVDALDGHRFEYWCSDLLKANGFEKVSVTPGSGDQGVDILAEKDGIRYAIQCKRYSSDLGNTPIQEVTAGKTFYGCHVGVVMTNQHFTSSAVALAKKTGVLLWDRDTLDRMLANIEN